MENKLKNLFKGDIFDLFLIRHPQVENYQMNVFNGHRDVGLSEYGFKQAEIIYGYFKDKVDVVYTSPLKRCRVVAEQFRDKRVIVDKRLKERSFGIFESLSWDEIEKRYPRDAEAFLKDPFGYKPERGESFAEVEKRVKSFIDELFSNLRGNVLIVAHGGINRLIIKILLGLDGDAVLKISQDNACINHFQSDGEFVLVKMINGKMCKFDETGV